MEGSWKGGLGMEIISKSSAINIHKIRKGKQSRSFQSVGKDILRKSKSDANTGIIMPQKP